MNLWDVFDDAPSSVTPEHRSIWLSAITLIFSEVRSDWWSPTCLPFIICYPAALSSLSILKFHLRLLCPANHCKSSSFCSNTGLRGTQSVDVLRASTHTWIWLLGLGFVSPGRGNLNHSTSKNDMAFFILGNIFWHFIYFSPHILNGVTQWVEFPVEKKKICFTLIYQLFLL